MCITRKRKYIRVLRNITKNYMTLIKNKSDA